MASPWSMWAPGEEEEGGIGASPPDNRPATPIGGRERCIQSLPASTHWPSSGQDQNSLLILDINAADDRPRRAIRAPKHAPYMTLARFL